jgi:hypothetical protein
MTIDKIKEVMERYRKFFENYPYDDENAHDIKLKHCMGMIPRMLKYLEEGRVEKVFRHLGFIQGFLWTENYFTIDELKNHSRPDK